MSLENLSDQELLALYSNLSGKQKEATKEKFDPTEGMSTFDQFAAGAGKAVYDTGRGIGQLFGVVSQKDIDEAHQRDAALMNTGAGTLGNVAGHMATFLTPGLALKGAAAMPQLAGKGAMLANTAAGLIAPQTYTAAALGGAGYAGLQPVLSGEDRLSNMAVGGIAGSAGLGAGRLLLAGAKGAKAIIDPLTQPGRESIVGRVLNRSTNNVDDVISNLRNSDSLVTGSVPTTAEVAKSAGISSLQRGIRTASPDITESFAKREIEQSAARTQAVKSIFEGDLAALKAARRTAAIPLLDKVEKSKKIVDTSPIVRYLNRLSKTSTGAMPEMKSASAQIQNLLLDESGEAITKPAQLYGIRRHIDGMVNATDATGNRINESINVQLGAIRSRLDRAIGKAEPAYRRYMATYKTGSKPIEKLNIGEEFQKKIFNPQPGIDGENIIRPNSFSKWLRDSKDIGKKVTGQKGHKGFESVLTPDELGTLKAIQSDLSRSSAYKNGGKAFGSDTFQNLSTGNLLNEVTGSIGGVFPKMIGNQAGKALLTPASMIYSQAGSEEALKRLLAEAMLDPQLAARLMESANQPVINGLLGQSYKVGRLGQLSGGAIPAGLLQQRD